MFKRLLISLSLLCLLCINSHATITWTKSWSAADDGSTFGGSDIGNIQSDISSQSVNQSSNNTFTGSNTFSGTTTFTGSVVGGTGTPRDAIVKGFGLKFGSTEQVIVTPGLLYHNATSITKAISTHVSVSTDGDYITGASERATSKLLYLYVDSSGNIKLDDNAPDYDDPSGNQDASGTRLYYYYNSATYYRCIGAIYLNSTGSGNIEKFYTANDWTFYGDVHLNATVRVLNAGASLAFIDVDCSEIVPSFATDITANAVASGAMDVYLRVNGSTATNGIKVNLSGGQEFFVPHIVLDGSQIFEYKVSGNNVGIYVHGYKSNIR